MGKWLCWETTIELATSISQYYVIMNAFQKTWYFWNKMVFNLDWKLMFKYVFKFSLGLF